MRWFKYDKSQRPTYPTTLPFSRMLPECCKRVRWFIEQYYIFVQGFPPDYGEFDDMLRQGVDSLLIDQLIHTLLAIVESPQNFNLSQTVQILINIRHFEDTVPQFEKVIAETRFRNIQKKKIVFCN